MSDFRVLDGYGIAAVYEGNELLLVNGKFLSDMNINNPFLKNEDELSLTGESIAYLVENRHTLALFGIKDTVRDGASEEISKLKSMGVTPIMLTGDNEKTAKIVAEEIGIDTVIAQVMPNDKAEVIKSLISEGRVCAIVGDGINDAVALSNADISISISGATDIAMDCADVIFTISELCGISQLISTGEKTLKIIKHNLFFAFLYNTLMIPIAAGALLFAGISISPMIASLAMVLSGLSVSMNSLRLIKRRK